MQHTVCADVATLKDKRLQEQRYLQTVVGCLLGCLFLNLEITFPGCTFCGQRGFCPTTRITVTETGTEEWLPGQSSQKKNK